MGRGNRKYLKIKIESFGFIETCGTLEMNIRNIIRILQGSKWSGLDYVISCGIELFHYSVRFGNKAEQIAKDLRNNDGVNANTFTTSTTSGKVMQTIAVTNKECKLNGYSELSSWIE